MQIIKTDRTRETCERLVYNMPKELAKLPIMINYAYANYKPRKGSKVINKAEAVKRCMDKLGLFKHYKGLALTYINLERKDGIEKGLVYINSGEELVLRKKGGGLRLVKTAKEFMDIVKNYSYATIKENKRFEYRLLMFNGKPFRIMCKFNGKGDFVLKQMNCRYLEVPIDCFVELYGDGILDKLKKIVKEIGIDLCGIDLIVTDEGKFKIIEVNSGAGMCGKSVRLFYGKLGEKLGIAIKKEAKSEV